MMASKAASVGGFLAQVSPSNLVPTPSIDWEALVPHLLLAGGGVLLLTIVSLAGNRLPSGFASAYTFAIGVGTVLSSIALWHRIADEGATSTLSGMVGIDRFTMFITGLIGGVVALVALLAHDYVKREKLWGTEMYVLLLLSAAGGVIMAGANDLIVLFLGLEVLSIAAYVLAAMHLRRSESQEAGMKYFVLGAFSSAFLLYGIALIYGAVGSTKLTYIVQFLEAGTLEKDGLLLGGFALLLVGMFFKIAAVPFHAWTPDVYQGSPTPVVAYMASAVKAAGFAALLRVFVAAFESYKADWQPIVYAIALLTMFAGGAMAIVQTDVKRMLAYSSISHAGFILVGVQAATEDGAAASLFYLAAYAAIAVGSFAVVSQVAAGSDRRSEAAVDGKAAAASGGGADYPTSSEDPANNSITAYKGLAKRRPILSAAFMVLLLAQAGVPFTAGFFAKFTVISAAVDARSFWLAILAMISAVISAFIYLRLLVAMYLPSEDAHSTEGSPARAATEPNEAAAKATSSNAATGSAANASAAKSPFATATALRSRQAPRLPTRESIVIAITTAFTLAFGIVPSYLYDLTQEALIALVP